MTKTHAINLNDRLGWKIKNNKVCISSVFDKPDSDSVFSETSSAKHHFILSDDT